MQLKSLLLLLSFSVVCLSYGQEKPRKAFELYEEAEAAYNDDRYSESLNTLNECLKHYPGYFEAYSLRGAVKELLKDNDGAMTDYSIYLEQFPEHLPALMSRAVLRYKLGYYDLAKEDFFKLLTMNPSETNTVFYRQNTTVGDLSLEFR